MDIFADTKQKLKIKKKKYIATFPKDAFKFFKSNGENGNLEYPKKYCGLHYSINEQEVTFYSFWQIVKKEETLYGVTAIAEFSIFKRYIVNIIDTFSDRVYENQTYYQINTIRDKYLLRKDQLLETLLKLVKENKFTNANLIDLKNFLLNSTLLDEIVEVKEDWTTQFCYYDNKHICPENNYQLVKKRTSKKLGVLYEKVDDITLEWGNDSKIHEISYTEEEIKDIIKIYNGTPLDNKEGEVYRLLLSSAVTNWFSRFLKEYGLVERKESALIGLKGNRKSFIGFNTYGLFGLTNSSDKSFFARETNINADLKNIYPISLSRYYDEIPGFSNLTKQRMKDKANGDRTFFTKNNSEAGKDFHYDDSYECVTANTIEVSGDDYDDKQFTYEPELTRDIAVTKSNTEMRAVLKTFSNRVTINSRKLGKYIYDELLKIDPNEILNGVEVGIERGDKQFNILEFGSLILDKIGLLSEYKLNKTLFLESKLSNNSNVSSELTRFKECFHLILMNFTDNYDVSFDKFIDKFRFAQYNLTDKEMRMYESMNKKGIYLRLDRYKNIEWVFNSSFLYYMKAFSIRVFRREVKYNSLKNFVQVFPDYKFKPKNTFVSQKDNGDIVFIPSQVSGYAIETKHVAEINYISEDPKTEELLNV